MRVPKNYQTLFGATVPTVQTGVGGFRILAFYFDVSLPGWVVGARYFRNGANITPVIAWLFDASNGVFVRGSVMFKIKTSTGNVPDRWEHAYFHPRIPLVVGNVYQLCVWTRGVFNYKFVGTVAAGDYVSGPLRIFNTATVGGNGTTTTLLSGSPTTSMAGDVGAIDLLYLVP